MIGQLDSDYIKIRPYKVINRLVSYALFEGRPLLTSGRWINPLVFALFSLEKKLPQLKKVEKPTFILGTGRSGTTLLGVLLSMHYKVGFLNEPKALWHSILPTEDLVGNYTDKEAFYKLTRDSVTPNIIRNAHKLYGFYLRVLGTERVIDKYPELIFRVDFIKSIFHDAKFIFIIRNGYDTCISIDQWSQRKGNSTKDNSVEDWWGKDNRKWNLLVDEVVKNDDALGKYYDDIKSISDQKNMAAVEWILTMKEGMQLLKNKTKNMQVIKFEDLTRNPEKTLNQIINFLDLPQDPKVIEYAKKVVKPVESKEKFDVHPLLKESFQEMMNYFEYK